MATDFYTTNKLGPQQSETREGFLVIRAVPLARTGPQLYSEQELPLKGDSSGRIVIDRDADQVFRPETIASLQGKPVTMDHPDSDVVPDNYHDFAVGHVINPRRGGGVMDNLLLGDLFITNPAAIKAIRSKALREVSVGYTADYEETGRGRGRQVNILANHLALVRDGRCGVVCRIGDKAYFYDEASACSGGAECTCPMHATHDADDKHSKHEVDYTDQANDPNERCGKCKHFEAGACELVEGDIDPQGWCVLFDAAMRTTDASDQYPVELKIELSEWDSLRQLLELWRYIRKAANVGHSFMLEADREAPLDEFWPEGTPSCSVDGDGADKVGRIFLNGEDVTDPPDDKTKDWSYVNVAGEREKTPAKRPRRIHLHF